MSMTKCLASQNSFTTLSLHANSFQRFHANTISGFPVTGKPSTTLTITITRWDSMVVHSDAKHAGAPPPAGSSSPSSTWKNWVIGFLMTFVVPFSTTKGGPIKELMNKVSHVTNSVEQIADAVEAVADKVDKIVEDLSDDVPEGTKIKTTLDFIERVAERLEKEASNTGDFIDKVQELEDKIEDLLEPVLEEAKEVEKEVDLKHKPKNK